MESLRLNLSPSHRHQIAGEAEKAWPQECCGLLVGTLKGGEAAVRSVIPSANLWRPPPPGETAQRPGFEIDPALLIRTERAVRGSDERILGHYHSHPGAPPEPSPRDAAGVQYPDHLWLIISVADGKAGEMRVWRPASGGAAGSAFTPVALTGA